MPLYLCRGCRFWVPANCWATFAGRCSGYGGREVGAGKGQCTHYQPLRGHQTTCPWHDGTPCTVGNLRTCERAARRRQLNLIS